MGLKIAVTGGSGGAGAYVVKELLAHGYEVCNFDMAPAAEQLCQFRQADLTDYGATVAMFRGYDAVVSFAANPEPDWNFADGADRFANNTLCTYNAFLAACELGMKKVVWASSETVLGFPFENCRPASVPVDETHEPLPQNSYAISKVVCEEAAKYLNRIHGLPFIGLRLSNVLYESGHRDLYSRIPAYWEDLHARKFDLWSYVDARDAARCARLALESDIGNSENFIVAAADTIMRQSNRELIDAVFPGVALDPGMGDNGAMISSARAARMLGWVPEYSWRDILV